MKLGELWIIFSISKWKFIKHCSYICDIYRDEILNLFLQIMYTAFLYAGMYQQCDGTILDLVMILSICCSQDSMNNEISRNLFIIGISSLRYVPVIQNEFYAMTVLHWNAG
jgi:hypothetical protein